MSLNVQERQELLKAARTSIEAAVTKKLSVLNPALESEAIKQDSGAFVSIHKNGRLRGCIGVFASKDPLWKTVQEMACSAASKDPRFVPVEKGELPEIDIEISVLSPLRQIKDINEIEVGRHGIYIMQGRNRGVLLPQVASEHGFDREEFLDETCIKAGLEPNAWREGADIYIFEAEVFGERERV
ncbi:MAG TPA: AMMECR1 domain-containing protein [Deltaproteobacteria bacterium]|nr:MAG: AMMECR1 domain-containing protein [Deltaproteobacteria bacterium GWA2_55_82]OGQ62714.1 MAG: AMMECR1 domain-containing protein [Deltaproteobacteria bacterium RIFCSPLOWO2_02_FULL_55_12]OIJ74307.1 MAG: AMMECR1 domain-containing protein [Deltaproteobacteria bacterium GWC2_55_46]HBG46946.1 AMMECR1 domain-containing protein [Deltaproteobacteria bacterium]HCY10996.1 AMMECR1 domain-containing protein [Deltaproteobacteria bacterium]